MLTGRKYEHLLLPLSQHELQNHFGYLNEKGMLYHRLIFGAYPEVVTHQGEEIQILKNLSGSYEFKWGPKRKVNIPTSFADAYPEHEWKIINPDNHIDFLT
jgi:hypothetical protein